MNIDLDTQGFAELGSKFEHLKEQGQSKRVYEVGTDREYGIILEMGRGPIRADDGYLKFEGEDGETVFRKEVSGHPPYPWFRPAIVEFQADPEGFILSNSDFGSIDDIESTDELLATIAAALENQMTANVNAQDPSNDRSPGTHPDHPVRQSGNLSASIQATRIR